MTKAERLLWSGLRRNAAGYRFRRQHAAGEFVLDFYCDKARLCVEVDGPSHELTAEADGVREHILAERWGILTLRFSNAEVCCNLSGVVEEIKSVVRSRVRSPLRQPLADTSPKGEGRLVSAPIPPCRRP